MMRDENLRIGQQAAASPAGPEGGEKLAPARKGWTFKQRMNALAVGAIAMALFRLFNWLTTPAPPRAPDLSGIYLPQSNPLAPQGGLFLPQGGPSPPPAKPAGAEPLKWDNIPFSSQAPNPPIKSK